MGIEEEEVMLMTEMVSMSGSHGMIEIGTEIQSSYDVMMTTDGFGKTRTVISTDTDVIHLFGQTQGIPQLQTRRPPIQQQDPHRTN